MNLSNPLFSIIVPTHNSERFVEKCLRSIINQTFKNYELIIVDDGSIDQTVNKARDFTKDYQNVFIYRQKNRGSSSARNKGLSKSQGEYILFVDSDDYIESHLLNDAYLILKEHRYDFINYGFDFISTREKVIRSISAFKSKTLKKPHIFEKALLDVDIFSVVWNKIFSRNFLKNHAIRFPLIKSNEDIYFTKLAAYYASDVYSMPGIYYHALIRPESLSRNLRISIFEDTKKMLSLEKKAISFDQLTKKHQLLFKAHQLKLFSYLLIQASFRVENKNEYQSCFKIASQCNFKNDANNRDILKFLTLKNRLMIFLCQYPNILRKLPPLATLLNIKPY
jgi:glycosyltransferase involved in cell wall biosynthesis